ncbi:hypothetical protein [Sphingobacterium hungaricum]|uniref:Uncharacterized protein n=1 Tax=Sphingobacterium hungaricum TaxID=2082723 RepID=A0A928UVX3_9SPHI|nr:hypothetical protein [Sphingobacterium hungaricum]MBE8713692.1 hypothetical protein [Sphingobacterium hungaricum]
MENFLPFLIIAAGAIYKIYTEYKKEQDKAAKRNLKRPVAPTAPAPPVQQRQAPKPVVVPPVQKRENVTVKSQKPVQRPKVETRPVTQEIPQEVLRLRRAKELERNKQPQQLVVIDADDEKAFEFDLRNAVIQAAILERPYR